MVEMEIDNLINIELFYNLNVNDNEFVQECIKISDVVRNSRTTIVQLIEKLELLLTDKDPDKRQQGTYILSYVLNALPQDFLYENQLSFVSMFYCDRLKDHYKVIPAVVKGILALVQCRLSEDHIPKLFNALFQNISCQQQEHKVRSDIFNIIKISWDKYRTELQAMKFDFIYGVISFMDGERDPRNLLFLFNWLPSFLKDVELAHLVDDMFEVVSCYFPVSFKPFNKEDQDITRDDLANALLPCLIAREDFAENCITLALDNLASSLKESKLDALKLLEAGCKSFEPNVYMSHSEILVEVQKEIFITKDIDIEIASLRTFTAIMGTLSNCPENNFRSIVQNILDTIQGNLLPEGKLFDPSMKIVLSLIKSSKISALMICKHIVPLLINTYNITNVSRQQTILLDRLALMMAANTNVEEEITKEMRTIPLLCLNGAKHESKDVRSCSFKSLGKLIKHLDDSTRTILYNNLQVLLIRDLPMHEELSSLFDCFDSLAENYPDEVETNVLNCIEATSIVEIENYLTIFAKLLHIKHFYNASLQKLLDACIGKLDSRCKVIATNDIVNISKFALNLISKCENIDGAYNNDFIGSLVNWSLDNKLINAEDDKNYCENLNYVLYNISERKNSDELRCILNAIINNYQETRNMSLVIVFNGLTCKRKPEDNLIDDNLIGIVQDVSLNTNDEYLRELSAKLLGNILNKANEIDLDQYLKIVQKNCNTSNTNNTNHLIAFIYKALIMRDYKDKDVWLNKLMESIDVDERASLGFKYIMNDTYYQFSQECYCKRKLLYRQKFFIEACQLTRELSRKNPNYLLAFGHLICETPMNMLKCELDKIYVLFISCLDTIKNENVLMAVLNKLIELIQEKNKLIEAHVQEFISRLLKLSTYVNSMKVRMASLRCLKQYAVGYPTYVLLPYKMDVIYGLIDAIDDKKRLVRKEAVDTRSKWYMIDAPQ